MEIELWKPWSKDNNVIISNLGRIYRLDRQCFANIRVNQYGYCVVWLNHPYQVHRLVAETFISKTIEDLQIGRNQVDHINTVRTDNRVQNLRWTTPKENSNNPLSRKHTSEGQKGKKLSEEHKLKISTKLKGRCISQSHREKLRRLKRGVPRPESVKQAISDAQSVSVSQFDKHTHELIAVYKSFKEAAEAVGVNFAVIWACCNHKPHYKTAKGFIWEYTHEIERHS